MKYALVCKHSTLDTMSIALIGMQCHRSQHNNEVFENLVILLDLHTL